MKNFAQILEYESHSKLQVPLLLTLGEGAAALRKATASGDTDLLYVVLLHLKDKMGKHEFEVTKLAFKYNVLLPDFGHGRRSLLTVV